MSDRPDPRRQSDIGPATLRPIDNGLRRQTLSATKKTPNKHRTDLGHASSYYFSHVPKTPVEKEFRQRRKLNESLNASMDSVEGNLTGYDGSIGAAESSFLSSSSSEASGDLLNQSTLSDTTELTASNFVRAAAARQRFSDSFAPKAASQPAPETVMAPEAGNEQRRQSLPVGLRPSAPRPLSMTPSALRQFAANLREQRLERQRLSIGSVDSTSAPPPMTTNRLSIASVDGTMLAPDPTVELPTMDYAKKRLSMNQNQSTDGSTVELRSTLAPEPTVEVPTMDFSVAKQRLSINQSTDGSTVELRTSIVNDSTAEVRPSLATAGTTASLTGHATVELRPSLAGTNDSTVSVAGMEMVKDMDMMNVEEDETIDFSKDGHNKMVHESQAHMKLPALSPISKASASSKKAAQLKADADLSDSKKTLFDESAVNLSTRSDATVSVAADISGASDATVSVGHSSRGVTTRRSSVSSASTMSTASGMSRRKRYTPTKSPRPLPQAIVFEITTEELRAEANSPFRLEQPSSSEKKILKPSKLTPSKLKQSPQRLVDSPARNTRSARRHQSPMETSRGNDENTMDQRASTPNQSPVRDSPARHTRSAEKRRQQLESMADQWASIKTGGKRTLADDDVTVDLRSVQEEANNTSSQSQKRRRMSTAALTSSLRKSVTKDASVRKSVAFGSPEIVQYNKNSPSSSMTPASMKSWREEEETVEVEADIETLLKNVTAAGSTPFAFQKNRPNESLDASQHASQRILGTLPSADSCMSVDSSSSAEEATGEVDYTVELEASMTALLNNVQFNAVSMGKGVRKETPIDEDVTVELESNMQDLFQQASLLPPSIPERDDASPAISTRRRRSSLSSRRFSLAPERRLSLSVDSSLVDKSLVEEMPTEPEPHIVDLKNGEILERLVLPSGIADDSSDVLNAICQAVTGHGAAIAAACLRTVSDALIAGMDQEFDDDGLFEMEDGNTAQLLRLQKVLRNGEDPEFKEQIDEVTKAVLACQSDELTEWLISCAEAVQGSLVNDMSEVDNLIGAVKEQDKRLDEQYELLSMLETKALRKARRKSLLRRKTTASALEDEIAEMEAKLARAESYLAAAKTDSELVVGLSVGQAQQDELHGKLLGEKGLAHCSEQDYASVAGMGKFMPAFMSEKELSYQFVGPCSSSCVSVSFKIPSLGKVDCDAVVKPGLFAKFSGRPIKAAGSFVKCPVEQLCSEVSQTKLLSTREIHSFLRLVEWKICRLLHTASELAMLNRRYAAKVQSTGEGNTVLEVDFCSKAGAAKKLMATFEMTQAYPFAPLNVDLDVFEGEVDMGELQNVLIKNAKPGFGYLSRTCDVIAAFLR